MISRILDMHRNAPYVISGSVDQTIIVWECRWSLTTTASSYSVYVSDDAKSSLLIVKSA